MLAPRHEVPAKWKEGTCISWVPAGLAPDIPHEADGGTADAARDGAVSTPGAEPCHSRCQVAREVGFARLGGWQVVEGAPKPAIDTMPNTSDTSMEEMRARQRSRSLPGAFCSSTWPQACFT